MDVDTFIAEVVNQNDCLRVTIPSKLCRFMGLKAGDSVKVLVKKVR